MDNKSLYENLANREKDLVSELEKVKDLTTELEKVREMMGFYEGNFGFKSTSPSVKSSKKSISVSNSDYNRKWTYKKKINYILKLLGGGATSYEVAKKLEEYDGISEKKAGQTARVHLSLAAKDGAISFENLEGQGSRRKYVLLNQ